MSLILRAHDVLTQTLMAEWQPLAVAWDESYNGPGTLTATITLPEWLADPGVGPVRTGLQLIGDTGEIEWTGLAWRGEADLARKVVVVTGAGWLSMIRRRVNRSELTYAATDQATIAAGLIAEAQRDTMGGGANHRDLHVVTSGITPTGVLRDRTYVAGERKSIGAALEELAAVSDGFRFSFTDELTGVGTQWVRRLNIFPVTSPSSVVLMDGANVDAGKVIVTGEAMTSDVDFLSGTERTVTSIVAPVPSYPGMDDVAAATDVTESTTIAAFLARRLADGVAPLYIPTLTVRAGADVRVSVGDAVRVVVGELGVDQTMRVETTARVAAGSDDVLTITLSRLGM